MSLDQDISLLSKVGLFQGFSPDQLRLIAFGSEREHLPQGTVLFVEGESADGGYVVASGQVDLMLQRGKRQVVLESATEGGLIGEVALMAANKRSTDAVARVESEVLHIARPLFLRMLREYPETAAFLHGRLAQSVHKLMGQLADVHGRLDTIASLRELKALGDSEDDWIEAAERDGAHVESETEVDETSS